MTRVGLWLLFALCALAQTAGDRKSVYIMPMAFGLDQHLAQRIARDHVMRVVADPKMAETVITDNLNSTFADTLVKLHPREDEAHSEENIHHSFQKSGSRGTLFLVDAKTRHVLWSDYEKPTGNNSAARLDKKAEQIVLKLQVAPGIVTSPTP